MKQIIIENLEEYFKTLWSSVDKKNNVQKVNVLRSPRKSKLKEVKKTRSKGKK